MWTKVVAVCLLVVAAGVVASATRPAARPAPVTPPPAAPDTRPGPGGVLYPPPTAADVKLAQVIGPIRFHGVPFDAAVERLREMTGANLFVDRAGLDVAGLDGKAAVDLDLPPMPLSGVLRELGHPVSTLTARVGYSAADGVIVLSTGDRLARESILRVYDVRDLVAAMVAEQASGPDRPAKTSDEVLKDLADVLTTFAGPEEWRDNGGPVGSIRELSGRLLVTQSWDGHRQVEALLATLREPPGPVDRAAGRPLVDAAAAEAALRRPAGRVAFHGTPFDEALAQMERAAGMKFVVRWGDLRTVGYDPKAPVNLELNDLPIGVVLRRLLNSGGPPDNLPLDYTVRDGVIVVSTAPSVDDTYVRIYDLADLIAADREWGARVGRLMPPRPPAPPPADAVPDEPNLKRREFAADLIEAIMAFAAPDSWREAGGNTGTGRLWGQRFIVRQTWENHQAIDTLLAVLRQPDAFPAAGPTTRPTRPTHPATRPAEPTTRGETP